MRVCELRQKEVVNICSCRTLGCPLDIEFNMGPQMGPAFLPNLK